MPCCEKPNNAGFDRDDMNPVGDRKCRDILFLLAFIAAMTASFLLTYEANQRADLNVLKYGIDAKNELCGVKENENHTRIMYCLNASAALEVAQGGAVTSSNAAQLVFGVCVRECPTDDASLVAAFEERSKDFEMATSYPAWMWRLNDHYIVKLACVAPTISMLNRCVYDYTKLEANLTSYQPSMGGDEGNDMMGDFSQILMNGFNDLWEARKEILLFGIFGGLIFSFSFLQLLKYSAKILVWGTILSFYSIMFICDLLLAFKAGMIPGDWVSRAQSEADPDGTYELPKIDKESQKFYTDMFYCFVAATVVMGLVLLYLKNQINFAIALVKESADVIKAIPQIILQPIWPTVGLILLALYFVAGGTLIVCCGELVDGSLHFDETLRRALFFHLAFCMWCGFLVQAMHSIIMGGTVATYYWTRPDEKTGRRKLFLPIIRTVIRTIRFNIGSACAGSLLLTIVKLVKWYLMYLLKQWEKTQNNKYAKYVVACAMYLLECIEDFIQFITKNAYIMIACDGHSFCYATGQAFKMVMTNAKKIAMVNMVSSFLFTIAKITVALTSAMVCGIYIDEYLVQGPCDDTTKVCESGPVSNSGFPMFVVFFLSYGIALLFFEVTDFAIDTLLVCFCLDVQKNKATGNYYASKRLAKFMSKPKNKKKGKKGEADAEELADDAKGDGGGEGADEAGL